jgi:hypothetical protein
LPGGANVAAEIAFGEHLVQMRLRGAQPAMNSFADVPAFAGLLIPAYIDADKPCSCSAANDLASLPGHSCLLKQEKTAHVWHTRPLQKGWFYWWFSEGKADRRSAPASLKRVPTQPFCENSYLTGIRRNLAPVAVFVSFTKYCLRGIQ